MSPASSTPSSPIPMQRPSSTAASSAGSSRTSCRRVPATSTSSPACAASTVAAIASPSPGVTGEPTWNTYVSVVDADATTARAVDLGAHVVVAPVDAGPPGAIAGRWAAIVDPDGAHIRLWQPGYRHGAQLVNAPGSWNSSDLVTGDAAGAMSFYGALFGWQADPVDFGGGDAEGDSFMWRLPGYGDFLAIRDPDIKRRHAEPWVPEGFSDAIGWMSEVGRRAVTALDRHVLRRRHRRRRRTGSEARRNGRLPTDRRRRRRRARGDDPGSARRRVHRRHLRPDGHDSGLIRVFGAIRVLEVRTPRIGHSDGCEHSGWSGYGWGHCLATSVSTS